ncbi:hypothetical protein SAY87_006410 [Trapa incisa]|uniref:RNase III domain-containing protein n=1 Tax=Trapa incisa TaxID=236973 RepID=A0AAN7JWI7_9MYRT|nr:hypothetical protein SAY87_006410 [Trapa incisa]
MLRETLLCYCLCFFSASTFAHEGRIPVCPLSGRERKFRLGSVFLATGLNSADVQFLSFFLCLHSYTFKDIGLLRRAMTHSSFSEENTRALGILGSNIIDVSVSFQVLRKNVEISPKDLNRRISEISKVESSCALDGTRLGLQKVIRVSPKTDPTNPSVICGSLRAIFGAIAIDADECDTAAVLFWKVHGGGEVGAALSL